MKVVVDIVSAAKLGPENGPLEVEVPTGTKLNELITRLVDEFGESFRKRILRQSDGQPFVMFVINGERAELLQILEPDDKVEIIPPIAGG